MAAISITATNFTPLSSINFLYQGIRAAKATFAGTGGLGGANTITASDRIWMVPIPANSVVLDGYLKGHIDIDGANAIVFKCGAFGSAGTMSSTLASALSISASCSIQRFKPSVTGNDGPPLTMSASADVAQTFIGIEVTSSATNTATVSLVLVVYYAPKGFV